MWVKNEHKRNLNSMPVKFFLNELKHHWNLSSWLWAISANHFDDSQFSFAKPTMRCVLDWVMVAILISLLSTHQYSWLTANYYFKWMLLTWQTYTIHWRLTTFNVSSDDKAVSMMTLLFPCSDTLRCNRPWVMTIHLEPVVLLEATLNSISLHTQEDGNSHDKLLRKSQLKCSLGDWSHIKKQQSLINKNLTYLKSYLYLLF